jgi:hypothetical protein
MCRFAKCTKSDFSILLHVRLQTQQSAITPSRRRQQDHHTRTIVALQPRDQLCVARYSHHNTNIVVNRRDAWCCGWCNITQRAPDAAIAPSPSTRGRWLSIRCVGVAIGGVGSCRRPIFVPWLVGFEDGSAACEVCGRSKKRPFHAFPGSNRDRNSGYIHSCALIYASVRLLYHILHLLHAFFG